MTNINRIPILESRIETLLEDTEPCDFYTVIAAICDAYWENDWEGFLASHVYRDLLRTTQSNPKRSHNRILRAVRLDDAIARYDDEEADPGLNP
jgi:hypothetical protein